MLHPRARHAPKAETLLLPTLGVHVPALDDEEDPDEARHAGRLDQQRYFPVLVVAAEVAQPDDFIVLTPAGKLLPRCQRPGRPPHAGGVDILRASSR